MYLHYFAQFPPQRTGTFKNARFSNDEGLSLACQALKKGTHIMVGIIFLSAFVGLVAAVSVLLTGASIWFALFIYIGSGVAVIMTVVLLTVLSGLLSRPALEREIEFQG